MLLIYRETTETHGFRGFAGDCRNWEHNDNSLIFQTLSAKTVDVPEGVRLPVVGVSYLCITGAVAQHL